MNHVIYFHGFASSPNSKKVKDISEHYKVFAPEVPYFGSSATLLSPIKKYLIDSVFPGDKVLFVGTSLGAYWAARMSHYFDGAAVLFNPTVDPSKDLKKFIGINSNFVTGEKFELKSEDIDSFYPLDRSVNENVKFAVVCANDHIVNSKLAVEFFDRVEVLQSSDHRFEDTEKMLHFIKKGFDMINEDNSSKGDFE